MNDKLILYSWRALTEVQRQAMADLIGSGRAAPLPIGDQRCHHEFVDLRRLAGGRFYVGRDGAVYAGHTLQNATPADGSRQEQPLAGQNGERL